MELLEWVEIGELREGDVFIDTDGDLGNMSDDSSYLYVPAEYTFADIDVKVGDAIAAVKEGNRGLVDLILMNGADSSWTSIAIPPSAEGQQVQLIKSALPMPPKFTSVEEADAWLASHE